METTLWDRQRLAARAEITSTALGLFLDQGFEATTIEEIVSKCGVSRRSFFRYFGSKEDIVLGDLVTRGEQVAAAVEARPSDEGPWEALRAGLEYGSTAGVPGVDDLEHARMLFETPSLRARHIEKRLRWQGLLVPRVIVRLNDPAGADAALQASAIVASALACLDAASEAWVSAGGTIPIAQFYDEAVAAIRS